METMSWVEISGGVASLIGISVGLIEILRTRRKSASQETNESIKQNTSINISNNIDLAPTQHKAEPQRSDSKIKFSSVEDAKNRARILFVDDDKGYNYYKILRNNGWINTTLVSDIGSIDSDNTKKIRHFFCRHPRSWQKK